MVLLITLKPCSKIDKDMALFIALKPSTMEKNNRDVQTENMYIIVFRFL